MAGQVVNRNHIAPLFDGPDGFAVVTVLWVLGSLAALVSMYSVYVVSAVSTFVVYDREFKASALTSAAVELAAEKLSAPRLSRPGRGNFAFQMSGANISVNYISENARIDINSAPKELLEGIFFRVGAGRKEAEYAADRIIGWRSTLSNDESDLYRRASLQYVPRGAKFQHDNELFRVLGLRPALIERALPFLTVYSGDPKINVLLGAPEVISALPGLTPERLSTVFALRRGPTNDIQALEKLLGSAQAYVTMESGNASRISIGVNFPDGHRRASEVVIMNFEEGDKPFGVLAWNDQIDTAGKR
jgi:general secretion pathway protein K